MDFIECMHILVQGIINMLAVFKEKLLRLLCQETDTLSLIVTPPLATEMSLMSYSMYI